MVLAVVLVSSNHEYLFIILNILFPVQVLLRNLPQCQQQGQQQGQQPNPLWSRVLDLVLMLDLIDAVTTTTKAVRFSVLDRPPASAISYATILTIVVKI